MVDKVETIKHMATSGPVWDGNLISKTDRDELVNDGYVARYHGWNYLTDRGVQLAVDMGVIRP